jgi:GNAT superfamily N-acetyltransferase
MASMRLRPVDLERDADDVVALVREIHPTATIDAAAWQHRERTVPERAQPLTLVAEDEGRVVGRVSASPTFLARDNAFIHLAVRESHRRRGIGSALYEAGLAHALSLAPQALLTDFHENDAGVRFATAHGFRQVRAEAIAVLDPGTVSERPAVDVELRPARDVDPHQLHAVDEAATRDIPQTDVIEEIPYDEWVQHVLEHPLFSLDGSFAAIVDGVAVAVSFLVVDNETGRATNMFTGTLPAHRGRGLGLAVKLASTHWAAEHGITQIATSNDETNLAMLAVNRRLGYRPAGRKVEWLRDV